MHKVYMECGMILSSYPLASPSEVTSRLLRSSCACLTPPYGKLTKHSIILNKKIHSNLA